MIRPLRQTHRRVMFVLLVVLPIVLILALGMREAVPIQTDWPFGDVR